MELELDLGKIKAPNEIIKAFQNAKKKGLQTEDKEFWEQDEEECFDEWMMEDGFDLISKYYGTICNEDMAIFIVNYETMEIDNEGGYPIENWMCFEDNGFRYHICAYGWTNACINSKGSLKMIGFKEKI